jgi:hypothetical protein
LYEHIRQHCYSEEATIPKKEIDLTEQENEYRPKGGRKKALLN